MTELDGGLRDIVHVEEPERREPRSRGTMQALAFGVLAIVAVIVFLLVWNPWRERTARRGDAGSHPGIVAEVADSRPTETDVTVWLRPGQDIAKVLKRHGLESEGVIDLGDGLYVVPVTGRSVESVVSDLKRDAALYDAGKLYTPAGK